MHTTDTKNRIIAFIQAQGKATNGQLQQLTGITCVGISKHLKELVDRGRIIKEGKHPRHTYHLSAQEIHQITRAMNKESHEEINNKTKLLNEGIKSGLFESLRSQIKDSQDIPQDVKARVLQDLERKLQKS